MNIRYGSVCSGIEAAAVAWHPLGWRAEWYAEIEPFPCAVLAHHYPETPNHGDMTRLAAMVLSGKIPAPEVLVGGTPCQAFSVAGMREGLADPRGALTIKYVELLDAIDHVRTKRGEPEAVCTWENVPGVLSDKGNAFGCFLGAPQSHPEPIAWMVGTAIWWTKEEAERDAAETGLPIVGLGPMAGSAPAQEHQGEPVMRLECEKLWGGDGEYAVDFVKPGWLQECRAKGGTFLLYTHADPGEVERLLSERKRMDAALVACSNERDALRAELRKQDALLDEAYQRDIGTSLKRKIRAQHVALSASAEPSAPVELETSRLSG